MALGLKIEAGRMRIADGLFDTNNRYLRTVANPANLVLNGVRGKTIEISIVTSGVNTNAGWRFRSNAATQTGVPPGWGITAPDGYNTGLDIAL